MAAITRREIPGTTMFHGEQARKGYALNKMCYSFNDAANRAEFVRDEDAYCREFGLDPAQRVHSNYHIPISNTASGRMVMA